ncbi:hypothetical protein [Pararobbsia alpina]|uniref:Uncharacterized protein n=1 Tax=Pararobbsia alpina TaxID=621374 RepID=A0A6S7B182_9BURK|nr:hypothetical protein [Pararobbsia alpina]CAB3784456.1 hypothetical protein LMG28138_01813 [Pararobbsia alpina]
MNLIHISFAGPTRTITDAKGERWTFEMHYYCGPIVLNKSLDPVPTQPGERSPFWHAVTRWDQGGKRLNGIDCVWEEEPQPVLEHIAGKHYRVIG